MDKNMELDYMIQGNTNGAIEIAFSDVPSEAIRDTISGMGMRYDLARRVWAGYNIAEADLREAMEVQFRGRPPEAVREALRGIGMRYHRFKC